MSDATQSPVKGLGFAFAAFAVFATHDAIIKALGVNFSVFQIIFFAMLFAFVPMSVMMLADRQVDNFRPNHPWLILLRSVTTLIAMSTAFYAFTVLPLAEVYALLFATPLLITAMSAMLLGETVRAQRWAAVVVGLVGVLIVLRPGVIQISWGHICALIAAFCSSLGSVIMRKIGGEERTAVMILYPMLSSILFMAVVLPFVYQPMEVVELGMVAGVGVLSVLAQMMIIAAYRIAPAAVVAPSQYSQILWATLFGVLFFGELPDAWVGVGASVIIASGVFIVWRESRPSVSARNPLLRDPNPRYDTGPGPKPKHRRPKS
ncbi:Permease of the drug/metabolite transporter (DMT) superfamily [Aliiroseovarius sediminilitoris]|uniref:Permease of the drug/metabolite transporter (DMT) superfamily n=1 Tax=Aliiroseovarius sediminilitoris TaxID=1173584 RepID=A0A1I0MZP3_9RHOB|nr:DMT family transporter [Aliiroseovarius sediminilitoris]SEV93960.1 Permease of the drug/metabolite transporter (DMT) superfamily [Aliiroseovarius sediminilitoris]